MAIIQRTCKVWKDSPNERRNAVKSYSNGILVEKFASTGLCTKKFLTAPQLPISNRSTAERDDAILSPMDFRKHNIISDE